MIRYVDKDGNIRKREEFGDLGWTNQFYGNVYELIKSGELRVQ